MQNNLKTLVEEVFRPLTGKPCWGVKHGYAACLTLEFGEPRLKIREPRPPRADVSDGANRLRAQRRVWVKGQWLLWTYACDWRVYHEEQLVGRDTTLRQKNEAVRELDGQILTAVEADLACGRWTFHFDLGGRLLTQRYSRRSRYYADDKDQWFLYQPDGMVLTVRADGSYTHHPGKTQPSDYLVLPPGQPLQWRIDLRE